MGINLTNALQNWPIGSPLNVLDLSGSYVASSGLGTSSRDKPSEITANESKITDKFWDIVLNGQGIYSQTWQFSFPNSQNVNITRLDPLPSGKVAVIGVREEIQYEAETGKAKSVPYNWITVFDKTGEFLTNFKWFRPAGLIKGISIISDGKFAVITHGNEKDEKSYLHLVNSSGKVLRRWDLADAKGAIILDAYVLSENQLALQISYKNEPYRRSIVFLNSRLEHLHTWEVPCRVSESSPIRCFPLSDEQLGVVFENDSGFKDTEYYKVNCFGKLKQIKTNNLFLKTHLLQITNDGILTRKEMSRDPNMLFRWGIDIQGWDGNTVAVVSSNDEQPLDASFTEWPGADAYETLYGTVFVKKACDPTQAISPSSQNTPLAANSDGYLFTCSRTQYLFTFPSTPNQTWQINVRYDFRSSKSIQSANLPMLWEALAKNKSVTTCRLQGLPLGDDGARGIGGMLRTNRTITELDLTGTGITDEGASALLTALSINRVLITLHLNGNAIKPARMLQIRDRSIQRRLQDEQVKDMIFSSSVPNACIPKKYLCPRTTLLMFDPVVAPDGTTYEREAIVEEKNNTSQPLPFLPPNNAIKDQIRDFLAQTGMKNRVYFSKHLQRECVEAVKKEDFEALEQLVSQDLRLLVFRLDVPNTFPQKLFDHILERGSEQFLMKVLKLISSHQKSIVNVNSVIPFHRLTLEPFLFEETARKFGVECARLVGKALMWNTADYGDLLFRAVLDKDLDLARVCAQLAPLDVLDEHGNTPLHAAVATKQEKMIELLLQYRAPVKAKNAQGLTPQELADEMNCPGLVKFIEEKHQEQKMAAFLQPYMAKQTELMQQVRDLKQQVSELRMVNLTDAEKKKSSLLH